jgi:hypothetical protein
MTPFRAFDTLTLVALLFLIRSNFFFGAFAGWINQQQRQVIEYLQAENRVLREQLGPRPLRFTDSQGVRLAAKAKNLPRRVLREIGSIVSPDTLLGIQGALANLGTRSGADNRQHPATTRHGTGPKAAKADDLEEFLKTHWDVLGAADFLQG